MLKALSYEVTFPSTSRTLEQAIVFNKGFGAVIGPNESGKSFVLEMIRFCLFGSAALRGKSDDYKKLKATLEFTIRGVDYKVERTSRNAIVTRGKDELAVGTKPVNHKIVQLLGFGLDVFDVACVCNQGDVEKLGSMKPTERKRMVDSVVGLSVIEDLAKWASDEALAVSKEAAGLGASLVEPNAPTEPTGYQLTADLKKIIDEKRKAKTQLDILQGALSVKRPGPKKPTCKIDLPAAELKQFADDQMANEGKRKALAAELSRLPDPPTPGWEKYEPQWEAFDEWVAYSHAPKPEYGWAVLHQWLNDWDAIMLHVQRDSLARALHNCDKVTCPSCSHDFALDQKKAADLQAQLDAFEPVMVRPDEPDLTTIEIERELKWWAEWKANGEQGPVEKVPMPSVSRSQIEKWKLAAASQERRKEIADELLGIKKHVQDFAAMYQERLAFERTMDDYLVARIEYDAYLADRAKKELEVMELTKQTSDLNNWELLMGEAVIYEHRLETFGKLKDHYDKMKVRVKELEDQAEEWKKVKAAMVELRVLVKQHLIPSLNKVASHLISLMTGGQRQSIVVDDEFDVMVDGQSLDTLSGSGKAVANLSLRLGLGSVLTNGVFSVFMGDEIDASMDADRAENTASTLQGLKSKISQILLVSHKQPDADYCIAI